MSSTVSEELIATEGADARGACARCGRTHRVPAGPATGRVAGFIRILERDGFSSAGGRDELGRTAVDVARLWEPHGGKMFGILLGRDEQGGEVELRAFSGQLHGAWTLPGWCPPLFDVTRWRSLESQYEPQVKRAVAAHEEAARAGEDAARVAHLLQRRRAASRELMARYHGLYRIPDGRGGHRSLFELFGERSPPSGAGDCCAPKLLAEASRRGLRISSMVEFYVGATNRRETRHHGKVYAPCDEKCGPILGVMMCGHTEP